MIPMHLKGKTSVQIVDEARRRFFQQDDVVPIDFQHTLEKLLLQAVEDAMMNADKRVVVNEMIAGIDGPVKRGVDFLNMVLPEDKNV